MSLHEFEGNLYRGDKIIRKDFCRHYNRIQNCQQLKASLRAGEYAWPGGYRLAFLATDGELLSFNAVRGNIREVMDSIKHRYQDGWGVVGLVSLEGEEESVHCAHTGELLNP